MDDDTLFQTIRENLFTAVVGDAMDTMGYFHNFLPPGITPLRDKEVLIGRAMTVLEEDLSVPTNEPEGKPFGVLFEALDDLKPGEVYVAAGTQGSALRYALFGGLMSTRAKHLKAAGAVLDGYARDAAEIEALGFTVFSRGLYAQDQGARGKVIDWRCEIQIEKVKIRDGDLVFADREGVLIIPRKIEQEVVEKAVTKVQTENAVSEAIKRGMSACDAFREFGVF